MQRVFLKYSDLGNLEQLLGLCGFGLGFVFCFFCFVLILKYFFPSGIWMIVESILARR